MAIKDRLSPTPGYKQRLGLSFPRVHIRLSVCRVSHHPLPLTTKLHRLPKPIVCTTMCWGYWFLPSGSSIWPLRLTSDPVDCVDLPIIDLAKLEHVEGHPLLATQVRDALLTHGFFYVIGHGYRQSEARSSTFMLLRYLTPKQTDRIFDIADIPFAGVCDEEKQAYASAIKQTGSYQGYKLRRYWVSNCL